MTQTEIISNDSISDTLKESLPIIRCIAKDEQVLIATGTLALWGFINLFIWFIFGAEDRNYFLNRNITLNFDILLILYGGLFIACSMLLFALLGFITKLSSTILLDSISLFIVGVWNIAFQILELEVLPKYGIPLSSTSFSSIPLMLGVLQISWSVQQLLVFMKIVNWKTKKSEKSQIDIFTEDLNNFVTLKESYDECIIKCSVVKTFLMVTKQINYTGKICTDSIIFVSENINDIIEIPVDSLSNAKFIGNTLKIKAKGVPRKLTLLPLSVYTIKLKQGLTLTPSDIMNVLKGYGWPYSFVEPYLINNDANIRTAAAISLDNIIDDNKKDIIYNCINSRFTDVQKEAINLCTKYNITQLKDVSDIFLTSKNPWVKIEISKYLQKYPVPCLSDNIQRAIECENNSVVKTELKKTYKIIRKTK